MTQPTAARCRDVGIGALGNDRLASNTASMLKSGRAHRHPLLEQPCLIPKLNLGSGGQGSRVRSYLIDAGFNWVPLNGALRLPAAQSVRRARENRPR